MTHRALVMVDDRTATLVEVGGKSLHFGHRTADGLFVLRAAWKYEYAYPLGAEIPLGLPRAVEQGIRRVTKKKEPAPVERPRRRAEKAPTPVALDEPSTWRSDRLAAAVANPY